MPESAPASTNNLKVALRQAASLMDSDPALAEQQAREILKHFPNEINALTLLGDIWLQHGIRPHPGRH